MKNEADENAMPRNSEREMARHVQESTRELELTIQSLQSDIQHLTRGIQRRDHLLKDLRQTLLEVKQFKGILPICAACKKIRDYDGYWCQIESYIGAHADVEFSHGICPDCMTALYPSRGDTPPSCGHETADNIPR